MALNTEQRQANYQAQRNGGQLTTKQRKRIRKQENKSQRVAGTVRVSRVRKAYDRARNRNNRQQAQAFIYAMRTGMFRPSTQARLHAENAERMAQAQAKRDAQVSVEVQNGEVTDATEVEQ